MKLPQLTISELAQAFSMSRDTTRDRLRNARLKPGGKRRGVDVYDLRDAAAALTAEGSNAFQQRARLQGQLLELELQRRRGDLCLFSDVEAAFGSAFKIVGEFFDTMPDVMERAGAMDGPQLAKLEKILDELREALYRKLIADAQRFGHEQTTNRSRGNSATERHRQKGDGRHPAGSGR